jgi:cyclopropane-fatty-acyl-phospholipid synthase
MRPEHGPMKVEPHLRLLSRAASLAQRIGRRLDLNAHVQLWDGSRHPLGAAVSGPFVLKLADAGVITSLLRRPSIDQLVELYIAKRIDFEGGTLLDFGRELNRGGRSVKIGWRQKLQIGRDLAPFLAAQRGPTAAPSGQFEGNFGGDGRRAGDNRSYISFHYDLSNDFYQLFLDPEMVYSCGYFKSFDGPLEAGQLDKLDMVCRKLRLKPGDRFLDIGCGWGGLVAHAATNYGVRAHGISLSTEQLAIARAKIAALGLGDTVTFELIDYVNVTGTFDKIASVGMYEHIGLANIPAYMSKVRSLLSDDGLFLNHAISRRAKKKSWWPDRMRPEQKALAKYIFPGGALDDIGHTVNAMERAGFEVHDVEGWRMHYARTCQLWHDRLVARRAEAITLVGEDKYRIYVAYLAGCALAFERGTARLFQTLASKSAKRPPALPPTRADLYR